MAGEIKKKSYKRIVPAVIIFGPAIIMLVLSLGHCENVYKQLPVYGTIPNYEFVGSNGKVINNKTQKGRITIFTTIQESCPADCALDVFTFNMKVYQPYRKNRDRFKNVDLVSILTDKQGKPLNNISPILFNLRDEVQNYDSTIWNIVTGDPKQVYNIESNGVNLYKAKDDSAYAGRLFLETMLLVDKEGRIRYVGRSDKEGYVRDFEQHVALLQQEYKRPKKAE